MIPRALAEVKHSLDNLSGQVEGVAATLDAHGDKLATLGERVAQLEQGIKATKEVVDAFAAAKSSMRFLKWFAGLVAAVMGIVAAMKGWLQK